MLFCVCFLLVFFVFFVFLFFFAFCLFFWPCIYIGRGRAGLAGRGGRRGRAMNSRAGLAQLAWNVPESFVMPPNAELVELQRQTTESIVITNSNIFKTNILLYYCIYVLNTHFMYCCIIFLFLF